LGKNKKQCFAISFRRPAAYPLALRINPGRTVRTPLRWELRLLEACLWAIPDFLAVDAERARIRTPRVSETMELVLSWADD
jgi:hypothetical protein